MAKGQSWIEFIVATVVFLFVVAFLFFSASANLKEETEKLQQHTACIKATEVENFLHQPGIPANWDTSGIVEVFGLTQNGFTAEPELYFPKMEKANEIGFANYSVNATPATSWNLAFKLTSIPVPPGPGPSANISCGAMPNSVTLCPEEGRLTVFANSTAERTFKLQLFIPEISTREASVSRIAIESGDSITTSSVGNGTRINMELSTSTNDLDIAGINFDENIRLVFIESSEGAFFVNQIPNKGETGAQPQPRTLCSKKVLGNVTDGTTTVNAEFILTAW